MLDRDECRRGYQFQEWIYTNENWSFKSKGIESFAKKIFSLSNDNDVLEYHMR